MNPPGVLSAAALLRAEGQGLRIVRTAVRSSTERLIGAVALLPQSNPRRTAEQTAGLVQQHAAGTTAAVTAAVRMLRLGAKQAAGARFAVAWGRVRRGLAKHGYTDPGAFGRYPKLAPTDEAAAVQLGQSFGAAWMNAIVTVSWSWATRDDADARGLAGSIAAVDLDGRIRRVAATETARGYADEFDDSAGWLAERFEDASWWPAVLKYWESANDRKVCATCSALGDSLPRPLLVPFPGGHDPGYVHAHCRCIPELIFLPVRLPRDRIPGRQVDDFTPRSPLELPREQAA